MRGTLHPSTDKMSEILRIRNSQESEILQMRTGPVSTIADNAGATFLGPLQKRPPQRFRLLPGAEKKVCHFPERYTILSAKDLADSIVEDCGATFSDQTARNRRAGPNFQFLKKELLTVYDSMP